MQSSRSPIERIWRDYGLSVVLLGMFLVSWVLQTWTGWVEFMAEQHGRGQTAQVFGPSGYFWAWARSTLENWQSEFLQLLTMVALTAVLIHKGSAESRDSNDNIQASLDRLERRLDDLMERQRERDRLASF